jgi:prepilin signal peptidase PulO-like enzyme (type II secretory pathway)
MEPSRCVCGRRIPAWLNLPVAGWLISLGRARCCGARIPVRYLLVETLLGLWWSCASLLPGLLWPAVACALGTGLTLAVVLRRPAT